MYYTLLWFTGIPQGLMYQSTQFSFMNITPGKPRTQYMSLLTLDSKAPRWTSSAMSGMCSVIQCTKNTDSSYLPIYKLFKSFSASILMSGKKCSHEQSTPRKYKLGMFFVMNFVFSNDKLLWKSLINNQK